MSERCFVNPHDSEYLVIDTLDEHGRFIRTRNVLNPYKMRGVKWILK